MPLPPLPVPFLHGFGHDNYGRPSFEATVLAAPSHGHSFRVKSILTTDQIETSITEEIADITGWTKQMNAISSAWTAPEIPGSQLVGVIRGVKMQIELQGIVREATTTAWVFGYFRHDAHLMMGTELAKQLHMSVRYTKGVEPVVLFHERL